MERTTKPFPGGNLRNWNLVAHILEKEVKMKHACSGLKKYKMANLSKHPHYLDSSLQDAPERDGVLLTVRYVNLEDQTKLGWGMRFDYCPACGEYLGSKQ
jgi:hypothetical protein